MAVLPNRYRRHREYQWVRALLIGAARQETTVSYIAVARIMRLLDRGDNMAREVGYMLGEISDDENDAQRPMLSAVAVGYRGRPGDGFFGIAVMLERLPEGASRVQKDQFWQSERDAVFQFWA